MEKLEKTISANFLNFVTESHSVRKQKRKKEYLKLIRKYF